MYLHTSALMAYSDLDHIVILFLEVVFQNHTVLQKHCEHCADKLHFLQLYSAECLVYVVSSLNMCVAMAGY